MNVPKSPVHPLSVFVTMALDGIWHVFKPDMMKNSLNLLMIVVIGMICLIAVAMIERFISSQEWAKSLTIGIALGILAAVPYVISPILGTPLLIWSGAHKAQEHFFPGQNNSGTNEKM